MSDDVHKKSSGAQNRKAKKRRLESEKTAAGNLSKWLATPGTNVGASGSGAQRQDLVSEPAEEEPPHSPPEENPMVTVNVVSDLQQIEPPASPPLHEDPDIEDIQAQILQPDPDHPAGLSGERESSPEDGVNDDGFEAVDPADAGTFPGEVSDKLRVFLVEKGPNDDYSGLQDSLTNGRKLTSGWFFKTLSNGKKIRRRWLVYSPSLKALFCFPCLLFGKAVTTSSQLQKAGGGMRNWKRLSDKIPSHENSSEHKACCVKWSSLQMGLSRGGLIEDELHREVASERKRWRHLLKVILDAIMHLAKGNSAFRGSVEKIGSPGCGNFLNTIELLSHYDPILKEHIDNPKSAARYLSKDVQNEFIGLLGGSVKLEIISEVKEAIYYSMMFDCTPDASRTEQMSEILRYVKCSKAGCEVKESFIDFIPTDEKTGEYLAAEILDKLESDGLNIQNCRGQCYDNGANMRGKNKGVQARISTVNKLARFTPCLAHSLNLAGVHAASANAQMKSCFGLVQRVFVFFAGSVERWAVLLKHVKLRLKRTSDTRWSAKAEAVGSLCTQLPGEHNNKHILKEGFTTKFPSRGLLRLQNDATLQF